MNRYRPSITDYLESRELLSHALRAVHPHAVLASAVQPLASVTMTPAIIQGVYGANQLFPKGQYNAKAGLGMTVAIVVAYNSPTIASDVNLFDNKFGLPAAHVTYVGDGKATPDPNGQWDFEESADICWIHAMVPQASIVVECAADASALSMVLAENDAVSTKGVVVTNNSWGTPSFPGDNQQDFWFTPPTGHSPEAVLAATGDAGLNVREWPADRLIGAGGSSLIASAGGRYISESLWPGSGPGANWTWNADPAVGFPTPVHGVGYYIGGTSLSCPCLCGVVALIDQFRAFKGKPPLANASLAPLLRSLPAVDWHKYPGFIGLGSPLVNKIVPALQNINVKVPRATPIPPQPIPPIGIVVEPGFVLAGRHPLRQMHRHGLYVTPF